VQWYRFNMFWRYCDGLLPFLRKDPNWSHPGVTTYYRNSQGRVFSAMSWRFVDYWAMTHDPDLKQYHQFKA